MAGSARPPFRADHVGSLLRPPALKALRLEKESGRASAGELRAVEEGAIREVVSLQESVGLRGIPDGELRRTSWHLDFLRELGGLSSQGQTIPVTFHGKAGDVHFTRPDLAVASRVTRPRPIFVDAFTFLASVVSRTPKLTIPSPCMLYSQVGRASIATGVYPDLDAFVEDTAAACRAEIADLYAAGCRYLQLDDVSLAYLCDEEMRAQGPSARRRSRRAAPTVGQADPGDAARAAQGPGRLHRSEEHTSELQSLAYLVCRLLLEKKKKKHRITSVTFTTLASMKSSMKFSALVFYISTATPAIPHTNSTATHYYETVVRCRNSVAHIWL